MPHVRLATTAYNEALTLPALAKGCKEMGVDSFIILDDVSSQKQTDFEVDKFLAFLDHRFNNHLPFLLTTNIGAENFAEVFGDRLASRMWGFCKIVEFETKDRRI